MEHLHQYVPCVDDALEQVPCFGDGLSIERMNDEQHSRVCADSAKDRLKGLIPSPQEFHKSMLLLQVCKDYNIYK